MIRRLVDSIVENSEIISDIELVMVIDEDDEESLNFLDARLDIVKCVGPPASMGTLNTRGWQQATGNIILLMNDDLVIKTPGWDQQIRELDGRFEDKIYMAYPDDMEKADLSTFPIMNRKTCDILTDPYPSEYDALFIDDHIFDIFIRLRKLGHDRLFYLDGVKFDHRHFIDGKARPDATYKHKNRYLDYIVYISFHNIRQASASKLDAAIKGRAMPDFPGRKEILPPPRNFYEAIFKYATIFLFDRGLTWRRRLLWFLRFAKYYAAMKGGVAFLKRKTYTLYGS
ncbi:conserved hypothetical protein [delta proteobacterium NaphS2]|nr:conserved hypothetical protein [delta proteobacterium NaphS2]